MDRKTGVFALIFIFLVGAVPIIGMVGQAEKIDSFYSPSGPKSDDVILRGSGSKLYDNHLYFGIEKNVPISEASLKISTVDSDIGPWINNPGIDVGIDGENDWEFSGTGYGDFGRLETYSDDTDIKTAKFGSTGKMSVGNVYIPEGSEISHAEMEVRGRFVPDIPAIKDIGEGGSISQSARYIKFGDLDDDDVNDSVVSTGRPGSVYIYMQDSTGSFTGEALSTLKSVYDYEIKDMDEDGDNDIIYSLSSSLRWIANDGTGSFSGVTILDSSFGPYLMTKGDMDGDGEDEIICSVRNFRYSQTNIYMLKRSSGSSFDLWPIFTAGSSYSSASIIYLKVGDWNNNGYADVYGAFSNNRVKVYQNPSNGLYYNDTSNISSKSSWTERNVITSSYYISGFDVGDVDGDGNCDVVIAPSIYSGGNIYYYRNRGTSTWTRYSTHPLYIYSPRTVAFVDVNMDGKLDILYSTGSYYYNSRIGWLRAPSNPNQNRWSNTDLMTGHSNMADNAFSADINSDGKPDGGMFFYSSRQIVGYYSDGSKLNPSYIEDGGLVGMRDLVEVDFDGDDDDDLLITAYTSGTVGWYENDGTPFNGDWEFHRLNGGMIAGANEVDYGDIDNDGDLDVAVSSYDSHGVYWLENPGDPEAIFDIHYVGYIRYAYGIGVEDFDHDGICEIVSSTGYYYADGVKMFKTSNPTGSWSSYTIGPGVSYCGVINITDMNYDGHADILVPVGGWAGSVNLYRNPLYGNPNANIRSAWASTAVVSGLSYPHEARPIDINNDGSLDVVASSNYGTWNVVWSEAPADPNSTMGWTTYGMIKGKITYPWGINVADVDDDGFADVFVSSHYYWGYYAYGRGLYWLEETDDPYGTWEFRAMDTTTQDTWGIAVEDNDDDGVEEVYVIGHAKHQVRVSKPKLNFPADVGLDLNSDGIYEWNHPGILKGVEELELTEGMADIVDMSHSSFTDSWGNKMISLPITFKTSSKGKVTGYDIEIRYNVTFDIDNRGTIKEVVDRIIPDYVDESGSSTRIYLGFNGVIYDEMEAAAHIWDLNVQYNSPPKLIKPLPTMLRVNEDDIKTNALDLAQYFSDDYDPPSMLSYEAKTVGPDSDKINVMVQNGANVTLDSKVTDNYNGMVQVKFIVTDNGGPGGMNPRSYETSLITIDVLSQPDSPEESNGTLPLRIEGFEGEEVAIMDLSKMFLFTDPDDPYGHSIGYLPVIDPNEIYPDPQISKDPLRSAVKARVSKNILYISAEGDWYGENIPLRIYGYDDGQPDLSTDPWKETHIDIKNVNDGPQWGEIPTIEILEDVEVLKALDFMKYSTDMDDPPLSLKYAILGWTNSSFLNIKINQGDRSKIDIDPKLDNWHGESVVTVEVSDGEYSDVTTFLVKINSVNDLPSVSITNPIEAQEKETGEISITGESHDQEGIIHVEVIFEGVSYEALGTQTWGVTLVTIRDYDLETKGVPIQVKAYDTDGVFATAYVNITIKPKPVIPDFDQDDDKYPDAMDDFDYDPSEWLDSDGDGVGDNTDAFPNNPAWKYDSDKDGIADAADEYPFDPENNPTITPLSDNPGTERNFFVPIMLWIVAFLVLVLVGYIGFAMYSKDKASKDPQLSVKYHHKVERRREKMHKVLGRAHLEKVLTRSQMKDVDLSGGKMVKPTATMAPAPMAPMAPTMPAAMHRQPLPPYGGGMHAQPRPGVPRHVMPRPPMRR